MYEYIRLGRRIVAEGELRDDRTGTGTRSLFGEALHFDLRAGFPILTTKKILFSTVVKELLWFIRSGHNINDPDAPSRIWDDWAFDDGDLGNIYGVQWRQWGTYHEAYPTVAGTMHYSRKPFDQLTFAINMAKKVPNSRRNIVSTWNVDDIVNNRMAFPPCHVMFQLFVSQPNGVTGKRFIDMLMYQRSGDYCLGVPFNISSYALLLSMIANELDYIPRNLKIFFGDVHIYNNHVDKFVDVQCGREFHERPRLILPAGKKVVDITEDDIFLDGYTHGKFIKYPVAV